MKLKVALPIVLVQLLSSFCFAEGNMKIIGHRGAPAFVTENTIESFKKAQELGVWAIELDVRRCKSGELVINHDENLLHVAGRVDEVKSLTLQELQAISLKGGGTIPTLAQALESIKSPTKIILDIKEEGIAGDVVAAVEKEVSNGRSYDDFLATGFEHCELKRIHALQSAIAMVPAVAGSTIFLAELVKELNAYAICLLDAVFSQQMVVDTHELGIEVWMGFLFQRPDSVEKCRVMGIDTVMVNDPASAR